MACNSAGTPHIRAECNQLTMAQTVRPRRALVAAEPTGATVVVHRPYYARRVTGIRLVAKYQDGTDGVTGDRADVQAGVGSVSAEHQGATGFLNLE